MPGGLFFTPGLMLLAVGHPRLQQLLAAIARGRRLAEAISLCVGCHGEDLAGTVLEDDPMIVTLAAPNLTSGPGGRGASFTDADFVRAIRHGLGADGR